MKLRKTITGVQRLFGFKSKSFVHVIALLILLAPISVNAYEMSLGTGGITTFSYFSGRILCRIINEQLPDTTCVTKATADRIDHLTNTQNGSLDLAIIDSQMLLDATKKSGVFQYVGITYDNLAILTPLYDLPVGIIVRQDAGIATVNDLKGKRINAGSLISLQHQTIEKIMAAKGWSVSDFERFEELSSSYSQDTMAFCHNTVQAMVNIGVHPTMSTKRLLKNCKAQLLNVDDDAIDKMVAANPALWKTTIQAESYPAGSRNVKTYGSRAILISSADMDQETAHTIVKALYGNQTRLQKGHPALSLYPVSTALKGIDGLELHTGAKKFFSEQ